MTEFIDLLTQNIYFRIGVVLITGCGAVGCCPIFNARRALSETKSHNVIIEDEDEKPI